MNEGARRKSAKQIFTTWAQESSIAGLNNAAKAKSKMRMLIWAVIFAFFSLMTVSNLASFVSDFRSFPVTTSINLTHRSQVEFPAVTICNLNRSAKIAFPSIGLLFKGAQLQNPLP